MHLIKTKLKKLMFSGALYGPFFERQLRATSVQICSLHVMLQLTEFYCLAILLASIKDIVVAT